MQQGYVAADEEKPQRRLFSSIRTKLTVYCSLMSVTILIVIQLAEIVGVPFTAYSGRQGQQRAEAFRSLELLAERTKEQLLRWIEQWRDNTRIVARNSFTAAAVVRLRATMRELSAESQEGPELWDLLRENQDYRLLRKHLDNIKRECEIYNKLMLIDAETGTVFVSTDETLQGADFSQQDFFTKALGSSDTYVAGW